MNSSWAREAFTRHVWPSAKAQPPLPTMPAACSSPHSYSSHVSLGAELEQVRARCSCRQERSQLLAVPAAHRGLGLYTEKQLPAPLPRCLPPPWDVLPTLRGFIHLVAVSQVALSTHTQNTQRYRQTP